MTSIRELVDPLQTLPNIELVTRQYIEWDLDKMTRDKMDIMHNGETVGRCDIVSEMGASEPFAHFDGIEIDEAVRRKGVGLAAYVLAIELSHERGLHFETQNWSIRPGAKNIWELLARRGVAEIIVPFVPSKEYEGRVEGKLRVPFVD